MKYEKLFEKGKIGKLTIKNRIVMPPMGTGFAAASGEASEEITRYYEERAKGGVGLIITEVCRVDELSGVAQPCQLRATDINLPGESKVLKRRENCIAYTLKQVSAIGRFYQKQGRASGEHLLR